MPREDIFSNQMISSVNDRLQGIEYNGESSIFRTALIQGTTKNRDV